MRKPPHTHIDEAAAQKSAYPKFIPLPRDCQAPPWKHKQGDAPARRVPVSVVSMVKNWRFSEKTTTAKTQLFIHLYLPYYNIL